VDNVPLIACSAWDRRFPPSRCWYASALESLFWKKKKSVWMTLLSSMLHYFIMHWAPLWAPLPLALLWHGVKMMEAGCVWCVHMSVHVSVHKGAGGEDSPTWNAPLNVANNSQSDYWEKWHFTLPEYSIVTPLVCGTAPQTQVDNYREC